MTAPVVAQINDRGQQGFDFQGKGIRMTLGARLLPRSPALFDHFLYGAGAINSHVPQNWVQTETGAGGSKAIWVPNAAADGGTIIGVAGATSGNAEELAGKNVAWKPSTMALNQRLVFECRYKAVGTTTASDGDFFCGFSDVVTATSGLAFALSASSVVTTGLTEGAMIGYSSIPTSGAAFNSGGNNFVVGLNAKATVAGTAVTSSGTNAGQPAKDSSYHIFRVEIDSAGNVSYYYDDKNLGTAAAAVTATTALTPYVSIVGQNSHANTGTLDYIFVGGDLA